MTADRQTSGPGRKILLLLGGGGQAAVVADAARAAGWSLAGYLDDAGAAPGPASRTPLPWLGRIGDLNAVLSSLEPGTAVHAAIGGAACRRRWHDSIAPAPAPAIIHPTAVVSPSATIGAGAFVGPLVVVNARARLGAGVIVNSGAIVEHDCDLGPFCHVAPGSILAGGVAVGEEALIGAGSTVLGGVRIGDRATLGAGAVAADDLPDGMTAIGVPARVTDASAALAQEPVPGGR